MSDYTSKSLDRFWSKVDLSKVDEEFVCLEWIAARIPDGYGTIHWQGRIHKAHRIAYRLAFSESIENLDVLHHCDNPRCVNPNHLFLGTRADNNLDRNQKGRSASQRGEKNGHCKLSDEQVATIRQRYAQGEVSHRQLAEEFSVSHAQIGYIVRHKQRQPST